MKNFFKLLGVVLVATFLLVTISCNQDDQLIKKGGTIEVTNGLTDGTGFTYVVIVEGTDYQQALADVASFQGTPINPGETQTFAYDKDNFYTVVAAPPAGFFKTVYLALGSVQKVVITK